MSSIQDMISEAWSLFDNKRYDFTAEWYRKVFLQLD